LTPSSSPWSRRSCAADQDRRRQEWAARQATVERKLAHLVSAIQEGGHSATLLQALTRPEREQTDLLEEGRGLERAAKQALRLPTVAEARALAADAFGQLAETSQECARLLRRLIPAIVVRPYRLLDGGHPVLRAHFTLALALLVAEGLPPALLGTLPRTLVVDLFDPPEREAFRVPVMELTANGLKQRAIAWELGISQAAVQHAAALAKRLRQAGVSDPYVALETPPADYRRLRRHRHRRYRFEPLTLAAY
jgi:site-specific DNA recombinase